MSTTETGDISTHSPGDLTRDRSSGPIQPLTAEETPMTWLLIGAVLLVALGLAWISGDLPPDSTEELR
jgi:hypothetical protein